VIGNRVKKVPGTFFANARRCRNIATQERFLTPFSSQQPHARAVGLSTSVSPKKCIEILLISAERGFASPVHVRRDGVGIDGDAYTVGVFPETGSCVRTTPF
jgi:hypothetical protein